MNDSWCWFDQQILEQRIAACTVEIANLDAAPSGRPGLDASKAVWMAYLTARAQRREAQTRLDRCQEQVAQIVAEREARQADQGTETVGAP